MSKYMTYAYVTEQVSLGEVEAPNGEAALLKADEIAAERGVFYDDIEVVPVQDDADA